MFSLIMSTLRRSCWAYRTQHGGILAEGAGVLKHGENGKGILSRWYPQTIAKRITNIELVASRFPLHPLLALRFGPAIH